MSFSRVHCTWCGEPIFPIDEPRFDAPGSERVWYHEGSNPINPRCVYEYGAYGHEVRLAVPPYVVTEEP